MSDAEKIESAKNVTETLLVNLNPDRTIVQLKYQVEMTIKFLKELQKVLNKD